jgi:hypothetical protein
VHYIVKSLSAIGGDATAVAPSRLEVHHMQFRSHSGGDEEQNLITLRSSCHDQAHRNRSGESRMNLEPQKRSPSSSNPMISLAHLGLGTRMLNRYERTKYALAIRRSGLH